MTHFMGLNICHVENQSISFDLKISLKTKVTITLVAKIRQRPLAFPQHHLILFEYEELTWHREKCVTFCVR